MITTPNKLPSTALKAAAAVLPERDEDVQKVVESISRQNHAERYHTATGPETETNPKPLLEPSLIRSFLRPPRRLPPRPKSVLSTAFTLPRPESTGEEDSCPTARSTGLIRKRTTTRHV